MRSFKRRSSQVLLGSLTFSALAVAACDNAPSVYQSVEQCSQDHSEEACQASYQLALSKWRDQPGYNSADDCQFGEKIDCEMNESGHYVPPMFGFSYEDDTPVTASGRSQCDRDHGNNCPEQQEDYHGGNGAGFLFLYMHSSSNATYLRRASVSEVSSYHDYGSLSRPSFSSNGGYRSSSAFSSAMSSRAAASSSTTRGGFGGSARSFGGFSGGE